MSDPLNLPAFDDLPPVEGMPQGCAWGVFDKDGQKDVYGTLNLLTPSVVKAAAAEVSEGVSVSLNWPINSIATPGFDRKGLVHKIKDFMDGPIPVHCFDDEVEFNTQCSTQWDSLVHFNHQPTGTAYNGTKPSIATLTQAFGQEDRDKKFPTLNHWHDRGGLVGRGVLVDYKAYADAHGIEYSPFSAKRITVQELEAVAKEQGTEFRIGDILIVRTGFTDALAELSAEEQAKAMASHQTCGVDGKLETARWCWNKHFAAVAGDAIAFETLPPVKEDGTAADLTGLVLHSWFLSLFGMPIGELWDLKALAAQCKKSGRYSFLLTSVPLNVPGGVGSPANAIAIF